MKVFHRSKRKSQEDEGAAVWVERDCLEKRRRREGEGEGVRGREIRDEGM